MSKTLRLHVRVDPQRTTLVFHDFPVRIGRDKSNECPLAFEFVSREHAHLELDGGVLYLWDDGSTCGTFVRGGTERLPERGRVKVEDVGNEFQIGHGVGTAITIRVELHDGAGGFDDTLDEALTVPPAPPDATDTQPYAQTIDPAQVDASALLRSFQRTFETQRHAWFEARHALLQSLAALDATRARPVLDGLIKECAWLAEDREIRRVARELGMQIEAPIVPTIEGEAALRRIRDLSATHVPFAQPLAGAEAISRFALRIDLVLRTVLEGVASLRVAYQSEEERAEAHDVDEFDLGAFVLDWTRSDSHARGALEEIFTTLLAQRAQLVKETAECFWRLAPSSIEASTRALGPLRHRALWKRYCEEYRTLLGSGETDNRISGVEVSGAARGEAFVTPAIPDVGVA